ncbi:glycosyltransferase [Micrococcus sp. HG099]|uniref:CgeB family protein n=1 Tax=Micrococcus sp. HG099 TaxID=2969755 RepID=UPI00215B0308|nr:glycosyltransferase [Micrococcus sp. HG099]MCR8674290.1 glycosyltransferase [Micrococcus sp. HG099]
MSGTGYTVPARGARGTGRAERLFLVSPAFHGYHRSIARAWAAQGFDVTVHCYDAYATVPMKLRNKALLELPQKAGVDRTAARVAWDTERAVAALRAARPDRVLVIKGDSLGEAFWSEVVEAGLPRLLWLYDDLSRHDYSPEFLRAIGPVLSYARSEAEQLAGEGVDAHYLPNGFDPDMALPSLPRRDELVFVGSRYPNRVELLTTLAEAGVPVRAYGRQWSHHPVDRLRTWEVTRPALPAERDIPLEEAYAVQAAAAGAINIHGLQAGHAMRTFEVPGMGGLQLVDRADVAEFYEPGEEVLVFEDPEHLVELGRRVVAEPSWGERIREAGRSRSHAEHTFAHRAALAQEWWT